MLPGADALLIALLSDIHANVAALDACLRHAQDRGADHYVFLGDFVGYGADASDVVEVVRKFAADGAVVIKGNHDEAIETRGGYFNDAAKAALDWARSTLTEPQKRFLASLPLIVRDQDVCYVHASAASPHRWDYIDSPSAARRCAEAAATSLTFCGHVHDQRLYFDTSRGPMSEFAPSPGTPIPMPGHRRWVATVGSVGQPRDRNPAAAYALFDRTRQQITFFRVVYDAASAADRIRRCGLPGSLAFRVELGI
ncbi:MAG TPA: metallophosphoesterase family protein [Casimicrobiaceae bacterium]|jgi:diadenosine tetraphosphatase ApaH/serine/threonine PP2A family protein phosphatase|nr:metallophosphoesterase family protein [Casimicrobiaceae bacterium]